MSPARSALLRGLNSEERAALHGARNRTTNRVETMPAFFSTPSAFGHSFVLVVRNRRNCVTSTIAANIQYRVKETNPHPALDLVAQLLNDPAVRAWIDRPSPRHWGQRRGCAPTRTAR